MIGSAIEALNKYWSQKMPEITIHMDSEFDRIKPEFAIGPKRILSFHGAPYTDRDGNTINNIFNLELMNGDVYGMLNAVADNGGIGAQDDNGVYRFIPWPCACVEVRTPE